MNTERLDAIQARVERIADFETNTTERDRAFLLAELRKRDEALWRVERLAARWATLAGGDKYYARHIRAALDDRT